MHLSRLFLRLGGIVTLHLLASGCASVPETFFSSRDRVWVARGQAASAAELPRVPADEAWSSLRYEPNNRYLLGWNPAERTLLVLNAGTGARIRKVLVQLPENFEPGSAMAVRWRGRHVWIASARGDALAVASLDTGRTLRIVAVPPAGPVSSLAFDQDADALWLVAADRRKVRRIGYEGGVLDSRVAPLPVRAMAALAGGAILLLTDEGLLRWTAADTEILPWPFGLPEPGAIEFVDHGPNSPVRLF